MSLSAAPRKLDCRRMKRLLVPIDFSDVTPSVIDLARKLARAFNAAIHLVHVREMNASAAPGALGYGLAGVPELAPVSSVPVPVFDSAQPTAEATEREKAMLAQWRKEIALDGIDVILHEPAGAVAEEILNQADAVAADMIVMGTHGHGAMYDLLVGSTTKGVLKRSTRPVLLVPSSQR